MKKEDKDQKKASTKETKDDRTSPSKDIAEERGFPGYPHYPPSEDIYNQETEVNLDPDDLSKIKKTPLETDRSKIKDFNEDMTEEDLDVSDSEADKA